MRRAEALAGWLTLVLAELLLIATWWPVRKAEFGIVDDHGIVQLLDGRPRLPLSQVGHVLADTLIEPIGRFRPLFTLGQVAESAFAGQHVTLWYVDRLILASLTLVGLTLALRAMIHPVLAAVVACSMIIGPTFDTWVRLGAAEVYAMPLLALGAAWLMWKGREATLLALSPGFALLVLAALAKENFLLVSGPLLLLVLPVVGWRRFRTKDWVAWGVLMGLTALDGLMIVVQLTRYKPQYVQARNWDTVSAWAKYAGPSFQGSQGTFVIVCVLAALVLGGAWHRWCFVAAVVLTAAAGGVQILFYSGGGLAPRYLYPLILVAAVAWALAFRRSADGSPRRVVRWGRIAFALAALVGLLITLHHSYDKQRSVAQVNTNKTLLFRANLDRIEAVLRARGLRTVVVQPYEPRQDQERAVSLAEYLHVEMGVKVMVAPAEHPSDAASHALAKEIAVWSRDGAPEYDLVPYDPPARCLSIIFIPGQQGDCRRVRLLPR